MNRSLVAVALAGLVVGCGLRDIEDMDEVFFSWDDRRVLCGVSIDDALDNSLGSIRAGIDRAARNDEVLVLYAHDPGEEVSFDRLEAVLEATVEAGVDFVTFPDLSDSDADRRPGVAVTFDDSDIADWLSARDLFSEYGARVTFFVTRVGALGQSRIDDLHLLAGDGHAIESHGHNHLEATEFAAEHGIEAWVDKELIPGLVSLTDAGFEPTSFAYPFGYRTSRLDNVALDYVRYVRSIAWSFSNKLLQSPCGQ